MNESETSESKTDAKLSMTESMKAGFKFGAFGKKIDGSVSVSSD